MIRIEEKNVSDLQVVVHVYGRMDGENVQSLKTVCQNHLNQDKQLIIHFEGLKYINQAGREYLTELNSRAELVGLPEFLRMELENSEQ